MKWFILKASKLPNRQDNSNNTQALPQYALLNKSNDDSTFKSIEWNAIQKQASGYRVILLIPTEQTTITSATLPTTNKKQVTKALPYALEEGLADDIENLHFVHHYDKEKILRVSIINKALLHQWIACCTHYSIKPHAILPDIFAIPIADKQWSISIDNERALVRKSDLSGYVTAKHLLPILLPREIALEPVKPNTLLTDDYTLFDDCFSSSDAQEIIADINQKTTDPFTKACSSSVITALPLNLLNNFYTGDSSAIKNYISQWKTPVIIALLAIISSISFTVIETISMKKQRNYLQQKMIQTFKKALPNGRLDNDYRLMSDQLNEELQLLQGGNLTKTTSALQLLAAISKPLKNNHLVTLKTIHYRNQQLVLTLSAKELSLLEEFNNTLKRDSLTISISNSTTSANRVDAEITIKSGN